MSSLHNTIKKILKETLTDQDTKQEVKNLVDEFGIDNAIKYVGGIDNFIDVMYDGNIENFANENNIKLVYQSQDGLRFFLHDLLVKKLKLPDKKFGTIKEKELGGFRYGTKNNMPYLFNANLMKTTINDQPYWKVVGTSGDFGFGYFFITKRNTMGLRHRQQIYKQIIEKYDLQKYM